MEDICETFPFPKIQKNNNINIKRFINLCLEKRRLTIDYWTEGRDHREALESYRQYVGYQMYEFFGGESFNGFTPLDLKEYKETHGLEEMTMVLKSMALRKGLFRGDYFMKYVGFKTVMRNIFKVLKRAYTEEELRELFPNEGFYYS